MIAYEDLLSGDIEVKRAEEMVKTIEETHKFWKEYSGVSAASAKTAAELAPRRSLSQNDIQMISSRLFATIHSFALALDTSDQFEQETDAQTKAKILASLETILEDLYEYELNVENNPISSRYLLAFKSCLSYANHYLSSGEEPAAIDRLLAKFVSRIKRDRLYVSQHVAITELVKVLFSSRRSLEELSQVVELKPFWQLFELLVKDEHKFEASSWILETIRANLRTEHKREKELKISHRPLIHFLLKLASTINDTLNILTPIEDTEHLSRLIIYFLDKISISDFKEHLEFFSRCRGSLGNLNPLLEYLARRTLKLAVNYLDLERKRNLRRSFLNACLAFSFTTIPSINSQISKLELYVEGAHLALKELSLSLADYYLRQAMISLLKQVASDAWNKGEQMIEASEAPARSSRASSRQKGETSKRLLSQVSLLLNLMLANENHIDLKHKLTITNLVRKSELRDNSELFALSERLNVINDDDNDDDQPANDELSSGALGEVRLVDYGDRWKIL